MVDAPRLWWWTGFAVFALIGVTWALSIAPMGAPDEVAHSRRAVAVARGQFRSDTVWPDSGFMRWPRSELRIPAGYGTGSPLANPLNACWVNDVGVPTSCAVTLASASGPSALAYTYVGAYQPGYYLLVGLPSRWLPPSTGFYAMRIASALLAAALLAWASLSAGEMARGPWGILGVAAAVTPTVWFLSGSINPNGVEIAGSLAVWTSLLALLRATGAPPARLVARVGVVSVAMACARPTSPVLLVAVIAAVVAFGASRARLVELWAAPAVRALAAFVGTALLANGAFVVANRSLTRVIHFELPPVSHLDAARQAVGDSPGWLDQALGSLAWIGFGQVPLPPLVRGLWWAAIVAVVALGLLRATRRQRAVVVLVAVGCLLGPIVATVLEPNVPWQGRYLLPVLVGIPILAGQAADRRSPVASRERLLASALVAVIAACQVAAHQQLMVRNLLGLPNRLLRGVLHAQWNGPVSPLILLAMAGLGSVGFLALCLSAIWRQVPADVERVRGPCT